jgi:hypothetical protein
MRLPLPGGPILIDEIGYAAVDERFRAAAEGSEGEEVVGERVAIGRNGNSVVERAHNAEATG